MSFEDNRYFKANEGFEFEIRHPSRPTIRLYALSELERQEWVQGVSKRVNFSPNPSDEMKHKTMNDLLPENSNVTITSVRLSGFSNSKPSQSSQSAGYNNDNFKNFHAAPRHSDFENSIKNTGFSYPHNHPLAFNSNLLQSQNNINFNSLTGGVDTNSVSGVLTNVNTVSLSNPLPPVSSTYSRQPSGHHHQVETSSNSSTKSNGSHFQHLVPSNDIPVNIIASNNMIHDNSHSNFNNNHNNFFTNNPSNSQNPYTNNDYINSNVKPMPPSHNIHYEDDDLFLPPPPPPPYEPLNESFSSFNPEEKSSSLEEQIAKHNKDAMEKKMDNSALNLAAYQKKPKSLINILRESESKKPLTLSELFRFSLFFVDQELAEDPRNDSRHKGPLVKGHATEEILLKVYQRYCQKDTGYMSLEFFIEFLDDAAFLQTHCPHDDNDEPLEQWVEALDPLVLYSSIPKSSKEESRHKKNATKGNDAITIDFGQFYQLLLLITKIVYKDLAIEDETVAFSKLIQESLCPLYLWCAPLKDIVSDPDFDLENEKEYDFLELPYDNSMITSLTTNGEEQTKGIMVSPTPYRIHYKRGSVDPLVLEERIQLVMSTYAPNLWKVFLTYACDAVGKIPDVQLLFPEFALLNEKGMYRNPSIVSNRVVLINGQKVPQFPDSLFITESNLLRFCRDYSISPHLASISEIKEYWASLNRNKQIVSSRLPTREQICTKPLSCAQILSHLKEKPISPMKFNNNSHRVSKSTKSNKTAASPTRLDTSPAIKSAKTGGLSFSEFIEFLARVALDGMQNPNYNSIFPTPYSKILAILTVWGVADMDRLEEVRILISDEPY